MNIRKIGFPIEKKYFFIFFRTFSFRKIFIPNLHRNINEVYDKINDFKGIDLTDLEDTTNKFSGKNFSEFKENLSQVLVDKLIPISNEIKKLLKEKSFLDLNTIFFHIPNYNKTNYCKN